MRLRCFILLASSLVAGFTLFAQTEHNQLSAKERAQGWKLLFDGHSMTNWIDPSHKTPPGDAWTIEDGCLKANGHHTITEDLLSKDKYSDFELEWDWKIVPGGNSGVKYRIQRLITLTKAAANPSLHKFEDQVQYAVQHQRSDDERNIKPGERAQIYVVGFEYQMIDNSRNRDAAHGTAYQTGALYSILGPKKSASKPAGEFNHSRLIVRGQHVEHWLNGVKVVDTTLDTQELKDNLAHRWGGDSEVYRLMVTQPIHECHFSLQNHDSDTWFRDIKIKRL
jgi:hypothetical protein